MPKREKGVVKWFNEDKGYGFIARQAGQDLFVHCQEIEGEGRRSLAEKQPVSFEVGQTQKGLRAEKVRAEIE